MSSEPFNPVTQANVAVENPEEEEQVDTFRQEALNLVFAQFPSGGAAPAHKSDSAGRKQTRDIVTFHCSKADAVSALWANGKALGLGFLHSSEPPVAEEIQEVIDSGFVDYLAGKPMKFSLRSWPEVNCLGYDRDNGAGAMARVAEALKKSGPVPVGTGATKKLTEEETAQVVADANASIRLLVNT